MAFTPTEVSELHDELRKLLEIWMRMKLAFQKAFTKDSEITREHENAFLQLKSDLSRVYRQISSRLPGDLDFGGEEMMDMVKDAISMEQLKGLALGDKKNFFNNWHKLYIKMTRTFGALEVINDGYYPSVHRTLLQATRAARKKAGGRGANPKKPPGPKK